MEAEPQPKEIALLLARLKQLPEARRQVKPGTPLSHSLEVLRAWQSRRLENTYADLVADKRFAPACRFFMEDVYGPRDFSQRDHDLEQLYALLGRVLTPANLTMLADSILLNRLSSALDLRLLDALVNQLGMQDSLTEEMYAQAYRLCDNYQERRDQIDQLYEVLKMAEVMTSDRMAGPVLVLARLPAMTMGWTELHDYLSRGYHAFKSMRGFEREFRQAILTRERRILERIYMEHPDPFGIPNEIEK